MIHLYGLILGISLVVGLNYFLRHNTIIPKSKENFFIFGLFFSAVLGARLYHVLDYWNYYSQNPLQILNTRAGGLGIFGGFTFGLLYIFIFSKINRLSFIKILDSGITIVPLCQSIGRFGNFFNHEIPTWWLESLGCLVLFFILTKAPKRYSSTALYLIGYGLLRFFIEFLRSDTWAFGSLKIAQVLSILFLLFGSVLLFKSSANSTKDLDQSNKP